MASPSRPFLAASPSPRTTSPAKSILTLDQLVSHFLAAKRSLSSTTHVWQANEIVASARAWIEDIGVVNAKTVYTLRDILGRLSVLRGIRHGFNLLNEQVDSDFKAILKLLDTADARTKEYSQRLRDTPVEPTLRPPGEHPRTLHDFVDETGIEDLNALIRECIDRTSEAQSGYSDLIESFESKLDEIRNVSGPLDPESEPEDLSETAELFQSLETHATEMAELVESLVRHYDLCMTALRHTEGGGAAVEQAMINMPPDASFHMKDESDAPPPPETEEDRLEMLQVIDHDAAQVDEVSQDIGDIAERMLSDLESIRFQRDSLNARDAALLSARSKITRLEDDLPSYLQKTSLFEKRWSEIKVRIKDNMTELDHLRDFYAGFLRGYDALLLEANRRGIIQSEILRVTREANSKIQQIYEEDADERELFKSQHGEYLPADIWPELVREPESAELRLPDDIYGELPTIRQDVLDRAMSRLNRTG